MVGIAELHELRRRRKIENQLKQRLDRDAQHPGDRSARQSPHGIEQHGIHAGACKQPEGKHHGRIAETGNDAGDDHADPVAVHVYQRSADRSGAQPAGEELDHFAVVRNGAAVRERADQHGDGGVEYDRGDQPEHGRKQHGRKHDGREIYIEYPGGEARAVRHDDDDKQKREALDIVYDLLAEDAKHDQRGGKREDHEENGAEVNRDIDARIAQHAHAGEHFILIALYPALAFYDDVLSLFVYDGFHFGASLRAGGLGRFLIDDDVRADHLVEQRLNDVLQQARIDAVSDDLHDIADGQVFRSLYDVPGHGVDDRVADARIHIRKVFARGIEQRAELIIPQVEGCHDRARVFKLFGGIAARRAVIVQLFAVLNGGIELSVNLRQVRHHQFGHALQRDVSGLNGVFGGFPQRFRCDFIHNIARGGDRVRGHHAHGYVITHGRYGKCADHGHEQDAADADQRAPGKSGAYKAQIQLSDSLRGPFEPDLHQRRRSTAHFTPSFLSYVS